MNTKRHLVILLLSAGVVLWTGCSSSKRLSAQREVFFRPLRTRERVVEPPASKGEVDSLRMRIRILEQRLSASSNVQQSLAAGSEEWKAMVARLEEVNRQLSARVDDLQRKLEALAAMQNRSPQSDSLVQQNLALRQSLMELQSKVIQLQEQKPRLAERRQPAIPTPPVIQPKPLQREPEESTGVSKARDGSMLREEYASALQLFQQREYEEASGQFHSLIEAGIDSDLEDNCEYWIGECRYALGQFDKAVESFRRVIGIENSNKIPDAYLMLGKTYETAGDLQKAKEAYLTLVKTYPHSSQATSARAKLAQPKFHRQGRKGSIIS